MAKFTKDHQPETRGCGEVIAKSNGRRAVMTAALMKALHTESNETDENGKPRKQLNLIANKLVKLAAEGDTMAIKEVFDRTEGKARQAMELSGPDGGPMETKWTVEVVDAKKENE